MNRPLIGEVLGRMGKLSPIDIDEILAEQNFSRRRFGEIALSWGLCQPEHICDAWCSQLADGRLRLDLCDMPIDPSALTCLSADSARQAGVLPIRIVGDQLILATARLLNDFESIQIAQLAGREVRFIQADAEEIEQAIEACYAALDC
jgi:hypothetical protein